MLTLVLSTMVTDVKPSPEGVMAARAVFSLFAVIALWALGCALRTLAKAAGLLARLFLVLVAAAALSGAAVAIIAQLLVGTT
ncbi:hypothetical protein [Thermoactinospora rubra]|uniref:hypothetical protein n=1 Tax=Thermoactinospora rubra TaxID=1088767 RepID=UPI00117F2EB4|nr:hypothetical protein [Thermoactinospora rubra]